MDLSTIEKLTKDYSDERRKLAELVGIMENEVAAIKRRYIRNIRAHVDKAAGHYETLKAAVEEAPELFVKPRTIIFHGVKVGYQKGKGGIAWDDDEQVIKLIKKHFPEQAEVLIKTVETPVKKALDNLAAADIKKLGITVKDDGDQIVIKGMDSEIDKLVDALLRDGEATGTEA